MIKYIPEMGGGVDNLIKQSHSSHGRQERASRAGLLSHGVRGSATVPPRPPRALAEEADAWAPVAPPRRSQRSTAAPRHCDPPPRAPRREVRQLDYLPHPFASQAGCALPGSVGSESAVTVTGRGEKTQLRGQRNEVCVWGATRGCRWPDSAPDSAGPFRTPSRGLFAGRVFPEDPSPCWALQ